MTFATQQQEGAVPDVVDASDGCEARCRTRERIPGRIEGYARSADIFEPP
jgi:hypothetical protein